MSDFPTLETPRLRLREIVAADAPALFAIHGDADAMRWFGTDPLTELAQAEAMVRGFALWRTLANPGTRWGIERKSDGQLVGSCGLFRWDRHWQSCVIGYELGKAAWGSGLMFEALSAVLGWGFEHMALNRVQAQVHPDNAASLAVLRRLGFVQEGHQREAGFWLGRHHDLQLLALLRRDWLAGEPQDPQRMAVRAELLAIQPLDELEREHRADALAWVNSGAELCRREKPATPPKHLISYFAVISGQHLLLVDHKGAQRWLPAGGHVEPGEHPRDTVRRELQEELGFAPCHPITAPLMVTRTETVGLTPGHTDVSLWYVVHAPRDQAIRFDRGEFHGVRWFGFDELPLERSDPQLARFVTKQAKSPV